MGIFSHDLSEAPASRLCVNHDGGAVQIRQPFVSVGAVAGKVDPHFSGAGVRPKLRYLYALLSQPGTVLAEPFDHLLVVRRAAAWVPGHGVTPARRRCAAPATPPPATRWAPAGGRSS